MRPQVTVKSIKIEKPLLQGALGTLDGFVPHDSRSKNEPSCFWKEAYTSTLVQKLRALGVSEKFLQGSDPYGPLSPVVSKELMEMDGNQGYLETCSNSQLSTYQKFYSMHTHEVQRVLEKTAAIGVSPMRAQSDAAEVDSNKLVLEFQQGGK